jgi:hypothetical protein
VVVAATARSAFYINGLIGSERRVGPGADRWYGLAGAGRFQVNDRWAAASRLEWFRDRDGFATGAPQTLKEITLTVEYGMPTGSGLNALWRAEYRRDWSSVPGFERAPGRAFRPHQDTLLIAFLFQFAKGF